MKNKSLNANISYAQFYENMKLSTFIAIILVSVLSCSPWKSNGMTVTSVPGQLIRQKNVPTDTIKVKGKAVVFFSLTQLEYEKLAKDANSGIDEVLSDFNYCADAVSDTIKQHGYKPIRTESRYIQVIFDNNTTKTFDRLSNKVHSTGYVLTNGQKRYFKHSGIC